MRKNLSFSINTLMWSGEVNIAALVEIGASNRQKKIMHF